MSLAECIAEYTGRPLLSLTVSDVGTDETLMERQLSKWFMLAERWAAVMLIDEAGVYLEKRAAGHIKRNGLVSVFLRCVETSRACSSSPPTAWASSTTPSCRASTLSSTTRRSGPEKIWDWFLAKLKKERPKIKVLRRMKEYVLNDEEMAKTDWNGREIRNVSLALYQFYMRENNEGDDNPELEQDHFEDICRLTIEFRKYLANIEGEKSEAYRAADVDVEDTE